MAIYTKLDEKKISKFFKEYNLGKVLKFEGIKEGIENTNYFIQTEQNKFILTIYEKRINEKDLPYFINLLKKLNSLGYKCPEPVINKNGNYISEIESKKASVVTFLEGGSKKQLSPTNCYDVGIETAKLHIMAKEISTKRENSLSIGSWSKIFNKVEEDCSKIHNNLSKTIKLSLEELEKNWPNNLPKGIIHGDLFPDNIFFKNDKISGIIDFYFSCNDFYGFEVAVCLNALCFDGKKENLSFNITKAKRFIDGYSSIRKLNDEEKESIKIFSQGAALRFLLTRVFDYLNLTEGSIVTVKDPIEYLKRLEFHNNVENFNDYYI